MKNKPTRLIDRLGQNQKDMICDNCLESNTCKNAYTGLFPHSHCSEIFNDLKYEILEMEDDEDGEY